MTEFLSCFSFDNVPILRKVSSHIASMCKIEKAVLVVCDKNVHHCFHEICITLSNK